MNGLQNKNGTKSLVQNSHLDDEMLIFEGQIRECFGRVVYTHKTHEKCADILQWKEACIRNTQIILSAITAGSLVPTFFGDARFGIYIATTVSFLLLVLNAYAKSNDFGENAQKHRNTAGKIWHIREQYFSLLTDLNITKQSIEHWQTKRNKLLDKLNIIYSEAPSTNSKAYLKAQSALKSDEEPTFSDKEIDVFLPKELRRDL